MERQTETEAHVRRERKFHAIRRRRQRRGYALLILAAGMLAFGVAAGTLYYVLRPTTLRIAVGPAGSEDQKLIQLMAQTFARENSSVRLSLVTTERTAESIALFTAGKADLAVARGDLNLPANAESVAILRKNVVVLWAPSGLPAKGSKKQPTSLKTGTGGLVYTGSFHQIWIQLLGLLAVGAFTFSASFGCLWVMNKLWGIRVEPEVETSGLDVSEHGMWGYPEFYIPVPGGYGTESHSHLLAHKHEFPPREDEEEIAEAA